VSVIEYDVIVIGAGAAGLTAAAWLAEQKLRVALVTAGEPTACLSTGCIDVCSRDDQPLSGIAGLPDGHPFHRVSPEMLGQSLDDFRQMMADMDMPYKGALEKNRRVLSAIGTFKNTCLVPATMEASPQSDDERIHLITFTGLKDFYPGYILSRFPNASFSSYDAGVSTTMGIPPILRTAPFWKPFCCGWSGRKSAKTKLPFRPCWVWNRHFPY